MRISGFTFMRNTSKLYYPFIESILSILPICDEFIIALASGDTDDLTEKKIQALNNPKIKLIHTEWDINTYPHGTVYAQQTDIAKSHCTGDWCFYLQSDELVHESSLEPIINYCSEYLLDEKVEGFLFKYHHFYGDYTRVMNAHTWYKREIRIVRNHPDIHSYGDAQSFKFIDNFDKKNYRQRENTRRLRVIEIPQSIYHYGWVRPPHLMRTKAKTMASHYHTKSDVDAKFIATEIDYDYGDMNQTEVFNGRHPSLIKPWIDNMDWHDKLHYGKSNKPAHNKPKHSKLKYRILSCIENKFFGGRIIFGYCNWDIIGKEN